MIYPSAQIIYPAGYADDPDGHTDFKVFRTEKQRSKYVEQLVTGKIPETRLPLTKACLRNFLATENIQLRFYDLDMPKNGNAKHWPIEFICPLCESRNIVQHALTNWNTNTQDWALKTESNTGLCLDCIAPIHPKDQLIPITLES